MKKDSFLLSFGHLFKRPSVCKDMHTALVVLIIV